MEKILNFGRKIIPKPIFEFFQPADIILGNF